jgi:molecular chaperone DnaK (HSP70)
MTHFGIDFGTTNSVLARAGGSGIETVPLDEPPGDWAELGFHKVLPTVLADRGGGAIDVGWRAKRTPGHLAAVKRLFAAEDSVQLGGRRLLVEEAAAFFFRQIKERAAAAGLTLDRAVVTIPANSRGKARFRTKISAGLSGIEVLALINEPTAAAMAYSRHIPDGDRVLVFDWGGGTLDVTVLQNHDGVFMEEASKGIPTLGGIDVDRALAAALQAKVPAGSELDPLDVEQVKIKLSSVEATTLGLIGGGTIEVTRDEFENAIRPLIHRTKEPVERCLSDLGGPKIDHLVLVGGSSKIPMLQRHIRELVRLEPMADVDPMTAVAEGAALASSILAGDVDEYDFFVTTEHALGTVVHNERDEPRFSVLIPRNTKLPAAATDGYTPKFDDQEQVLVRVIEGDPDAAFDHEDNVILKEWEVQLFEPRPVSEASFSITFQYDTDGILHVKTVDAKTGTVMLDEELSFGAAMSKTELGEVRRRIDSLGSASPDGPERDEPGVPTAPPPPTGLSEESRAAVRKAKEKIHPFVDDATQQQLDALIQDLVNAPPDSEAEARTNLERAIREHSYLL